MTPFSSDQWILLALIFLLGLFVGMSMFAGGKWKRRYREEVTRREAAEAERDSMAARTAAANERINRLEHGGLIAAGTAGAVAAGARGKRDDLASIRGIGPQGETRLNEMGVHSYKDLESLDERRVAELEGGWGAEPGHIEREGWREQARLLREGKKDEHLKLYPQPPL
jgi:predicted flap endonuclease-1-like 5' DNA nuclease